MQTILTLTINPAVDKFASVDEVVPTKKLRCRRPQHDPGGGGINVSRVIRRLGGDSLAIYPAGGPTGDMLRQLLDAEELRQQRIPIDDWTRENMTVFEERSGRHYRFGMPGAALRPEEWQDCLSVLERQSRPDYIVASGSLPPGVPDDFYGRVAAIAQRWESRLIVDTSGNALRHAVEAGVFLLKPNLREFRELTGAELNSQDEQVRHARGLIEAGRCEAVMLSLEADGLLLVSRDITERVIAPPVDVLSTVGAGDSAVGGLTFALAQGRNLREAACFAVAAGTAAVLTPGTELCRPEDVERIYGQLTCSP